jgi:hypothetical protein
VSARRTSAEVLADLERDGLLRVLPDPGQPWQEQNSPAYDHGYDDAAEAEADQPDPLLCEFCQDHPKEPGSNACANGFCQAEALR